MHKQSSICPICGSYMQFIKNNTWLACSCGYHVKVIKRLITPLRSSK